MLNSRCAINQAKVQDVLFLLIVDIKASCDFVLEVTVDFAGVVLYLDLSHSGHS